LSPEFAESRGLIVSQGSDKTFIFSILITLVTRL
jgi:hypothetical protein